MLQINTTPNYAGVTISGDFLDFDALYEALHEVTGEENDFPHYYSAKIRVFALCYDLRHALMGDRDITFIDNGMDADKMKYMSVITSEKNVYLTIQMLWPELLFVTIALNDFVKLYGAKQSKDRFTYLQDKHNIWDRNIAQVRMFQAAVASCLKEELTPNMFSRTMNMLNGRYFSVGGYITQYIDVLNEQFLQMNKEKRMKSISLMAKRLTELNGDYQDIREIVREAAARYGCPPDDVRLNVEYPEEIEW
ncbi:hypothetical protein MUG87_11295 [Ectobacillus sp. JY-23]|uniref:DUF6904 family protein n=1 Tax=Ectobacillus sp. JY-23 TaxID=2933872 RepID=UPI001FF4BA04|nr:hypothetical protein [Ectobacillus sp. JY-23]UOY91146.1 hypothetical protein MUG87_11295 [Ectobacillus sp. JY-23]